MIRFGLEYRLLSVLSVGVALLALGAGCGDGKTMGNVSGEVIYGGKPLREGEVNFHNKQRGAGSVAKIDSSGKFTLPDPLEAGEYTVYVTTPAPTPQDPKLGGGAKKTGTVQIPPKYRDPATSGLSVTVTKGPNHVELKLTD